MIEIRNGLYESADFKLSVNAVLVHTGITAVLGPSGAGKSTLLNIICGFEDLSQGQVLINDVVSNQVPPHQRPLMAVFQDNNCFAHLTGSGHR
jgi:thiamine transport system ATP-binding protein